MRPEQTAVGERGPALVVAGMHRSGTSAMARVLSLAGGSLPERVIEPGPDNPLGFWEPWEMVALSDEILTDVGSSWDDLFVHAANPRAWARRGDFLTRARAFVVQNFGERSLPVLKDPRASVLTSLWHQALALEAYRPIYVVMVRNPLEVAESLAARDGFPVTKSLLLWTAYMLAVERDTRGRPRLFVSYPDLIADWRAVLDRIEAVVGGPLPGRTETSALETDRFLSNSHRHHEARDDDLTVLGVLSVVETVHAWMQAAAAGAPPDVSVMDEAERALDRLAATLRPIQEDQGRRAALREASVLTELADAEARLVRARAHVRETLLGFGEREAAGTRAIHALETELASETLRADAGTAESDRLTAELRATHLSMTGLQTALAEKVAALEAQQADIAQRDGQLSEMRRRLVDQDSRVAGFEQQLGETAARIAELERQLGERAGHVADLETDKRHAEMREAELVARIETMKQSLSWKVARPIRVVQGRLKRARSSPS